MTAAARRAMLRGMRARPAVVIPGIKGTSLEDFYPFDVRTTWSAWDAATGPDLRALALDPAADVDLADDVVNRAGQALPVAYRAFVTALRDRSTVPVYVFPYDWRLSIEINARRLAQFLAALQRKPMRMVPGWDGSFDFVGHSLGGLVFRALLSAWPGPLPIGQVVFLATPHLGALDALEAMIRGETALFEGRKELRKLARGFPAVYELLPRFDRAVTRDGQPVDVFDASSWQSNVTGSDPESVAQAQLDRARQVLASLPDPRDPRFGLAGRILSVVGARDDSTLREVAVVAQRGDVRNWYDFDHPVRRVEGDEVVPVESAQLPGVPFVRVAWSDVSYLRDWKARLVSFHAFLPELDEVQTIVSRFWEGATQRDLLPVSLAPDPLAFGIA